MTGAVTAEFAVALPAVLLLLALLLSGAAAGVTQLRLEEAAHAGARALARGEDPAAVEGIVRTLAGTSATVSVTAGNRVTGVHGGDHHERGSGTVLAAGLAMVVIMALALMLLMAQSAVMASRAAAAADLAALAGADALRGLTSGDPCTVAADVAVQHNATVLSCTEGTGQTLEVRTVLNVRTLLGAASGHARAGPPP